QRDTASMPVTTSIPRFTATETLYLIVGQNMGDYHVVGHAPTPAIIEQRNCEWMDKQSSGPKGLIFHSFLNDERLTTDGSRRRALSTKASVEISNG
ncbi:MAG: hypothetical protein LQ338_007039, partial [Usnochroma carphineum]